MGKRVLVTTSTFPAHETDPVPSFIRDFVLTMKRHDPELEISVLAPHDSRSNTQNFTRHDAYDEYRYRYMWPSRLERLSGQGGIIPSLKKHRWLYVVVPFFLLAQTVAVVRLARKTDADIIHAHWLIPQGIAAILANILLSKPVLISVHGSDVLALNNPPAAALKRFAINAAHTVVANSSSSYAHLEKLVPSRTYPIIPVGTRVSDFISHPSIHSPLRILFIGRLSEEKGTDDLIAALAILKKSGIPFAAKIAGSGPLESVLKKQAEASDLSEDIEFIGWVARRDIDALYDWADVFVGPSLREALGVVFMEAGAHGLPVVTTNIGGIPDVVVHGITGITVPPHKPGEIADAIQKLVNNPSMYRDMGKAAREHIAANFSWVSVAQRYDELYKELGASH